MKGPGSCHVHRRVVTLTITVTVLLGVLSLWAAVASGSTSPAATASPSASPVTLRLGWDESPLNLNPFVGYSNSYEIWMLNYDTLVAFGADGKPSTETGLAEKWETSPDYKVWTFHIRPGVTWQDGVQLTARDVAFTFNTIIRDKLSLAVYLKDVTRAVATDDHTLTVYCSKPKANMLTTQVYIYVLPQHVWGKVGAKAIGNTFQNPVPIIGSGPFQTVEFKKDGYVKMVRNPHYWGKRPTLGQVIFEYYTNSDTMVADLKSGAIDGAQVVPPEQFKRLGGTPGIKPIAYPLYNWEYIDINCYDDPASLGNPVLRDVRFRRAIAWAIDRKKCAELGWSGLAQAGTGIYPQKGWPAGSDPYYQPSAQDYIGFDLAKARQLLDQAGYKDTNGDGIRDYKGKPIKLRLWSRDISPQSEIQGKLIAGWLRSIGLQIQLSVVDEGQLDSQIWNYKGNTYAPDYDLALWDFMGYVDPGDSAACFTTDQIGNYNEMSWSNAQYDKLTALQYQEMDPQKRLAILGQMQQIFYREQPQIVLDYPSVLQAVNTAKWDGWQPYMNGSVWNNFLDRQSYIDLRPKAAAVAGGSSSSSTIWVVLAAAAVVVIAAAVVLLRRSRGRAVEE